eukprot:TRINITY_DN44492_c0_g1_i3.p1 TRINITY_DN44492_c0_g1~~TRINITY_DN44492_c0_g1_i3.p1  ORF type:complete len:332 (-),score=45.88 TRINITY_DN44492_c0_g1_i3:530-1525(-)
MTSVSKEDEDRDAGECLFSGDAVKLKDMLKLMRELLEDGEPKLCLRLFEKVESSADAEAVVLGLSEESWQDIHGYITRKARGEATQEEITDDEAWLLSLTTPASSPTIAEGSTGRSKGVAYHLQRVRDLREAAAVEPSDRDSSEESDVPRCTGTSTMPASPTGRRTSSEDVPSLLSTLSSPRQSPRSSEAAEVEEGEEGSERRSQSCASAISIPPNAALPRPPTSRSTAGSRRRYDSKASTRASTSTSKEPLPSPQRCAAALNIPLWTELMCTTSPRSSTEGSFSSAASMGDYGLLQHSVQRLPGEAESMHRFAKPGSSGASFDSTGDDCS